MGFEIGDILEDGELNLASVWGRGLSAAEDREMPHRGVEGTTDVMDRVTDADPDIEVVRGDESVHDEPVFGGGSFVWLGPQDKGMILDVGVYERHEFLYVSVCPSQLRVDSVDPSPTL